MEERIPLCNQWRGWLAKNKLLGYSNEEIMAQMLSKGIPRATIEQELSGLETHPYFQAGQEIAGKLNRRLGLLEAMRKLHAQSAKAGKVDRLRKVDSAQFFENYYFANRPVIMTEAMTDWEALKKWSPAFFREQYGQLNVEVMTGREADPEYEIYADRHKTKMRFAEYIDQIEAASAKGGCNDFYLVGNNYFFKQEKAKSLLNDIRIFPEYLDGTAVPGKVNFWFGPAGTITPLHHDVLNVMMAQVYGKKKILLIPSFEVHLLYNHIGVFSEVDLENPDFDQFPLLKWANIIEIELSPGEALFIPVGWFHHVKAIETSITFSFTNFKVPNHYKWGN